MHRTRSLAASVRSGYRAASSSPVVELREYQLIPGRAAEYMKLANDTAELRKSLVPLRLFSTPEVGGTLNMATVR